jgi:hypothetical protein
MGFEPRLGVSDIHGTVAVAGEVDPDRGLRPDVDVNVLAARVEPAAEALAGSL